MSLLSQVRGFSKNSLKKSDTMVTTASGDQFLETRRDDGTVTTTHVGKLEIEDRDVGHILPGQLLLGSQLVASDFEVLKEYNVTHIINAASFFDNLFPEDFKYLKFDVDDLPDVIITDTFPASFEFIDCAIQDGGCVLVHCNRGVSRSASIVIGYLMDRKGMSYEEAYDHVKQKRSAVSPNYGFRSQLEKYKK